MALTYNARVPGLYSLPCYMHQKHGMGFSAPNLVVGYAATCYFSSSPDALARLSSRLWFQPETTRESTDST